MTNLEERREGELALTVIAILAIIALASLGLLLNEMWYENNFFWYGVVTILFFTAITVIYFVRTRKKLKNEWHLDLSRDCMLSIEVLQGLNPKYTEDYLNWWADKSNMRVTPVARIPPAPAWHERIANLFRVHSSKHYAYVFSVVRKDASLGKKIGTNEVYPDYETALEALEVRL